MTNLKNDTDKCKIIAYLGDNTGWEENDIKISKLDYINYAFALVSNGKIKGDHLKKLDLLNKLKIKNPNLKTVISIGGWGADGFSDAALTEESRTIFVNSTIEFMKSNNFDGIDLDWEYPCSDQAGIVARSEDKRNFTQLLKLFREKLNYQGELDKKYYVLTIAMGAGQQYVDDVEIDEIHKYLDFINLMTYDMRGSFTDITGHHTNLFSPKGQPSEISGDRAVEILISAGIPVSKIVLGAAFYGRMWECVANTHNGLNVKAETTGCKTRDYSVLVKDYVNKNGFKRFWDENTKSPYLFNGNTFISYDDEESLEYKAQYVINKKLGGFMFWEYFLDNTGKLVDKIYSVISNN